MKQNTLKSPVSFEGVGLHLGKHAKVTLHPADINKGIVIKKQLNEKEITLAIDRFKVSDTTRCTVIEGKGLTIYTVEHLLSVLKGMRIDNVIIEIQGDEIPILDGSGLELVKLIKKIGIEEQDEEKKYFRPKKVISVKDEENGSEITLIPDDVLDIKVMVDFDAQSLPAQMFSYTETTDYINEIAPARTFVFLHEIMPLINQGLVQGGALENAVIFIEKELNEDEKRKVEEFTDYPIVLGSVLNKDGLRFSNEPARHKMLDVIGDLAMAGVDLKGKIVAYKPGHTINAKFVQVVKDEYAKEVKLRGKPEYDPNKEPIYTARDIKNTLPHRYPFLLVDKIVELTETHVVGIKNISSDQSFYNGHFPNNPIFPGVLQIEAMAQTGGILILSRQEVPSEWDTFFMKIDKVKFKHMVVPGDTMVMKLELLSPIRRGICHMFGTAYVGDKIVSEGELLAQIVKKTT